MPKQAGIQWVTPPSELADAIRQYGNRALVATHAVSAHVGAQMQNSARENAPWHDRTGNARGGLFFAVDGFNLHPVLGETKPKEPEAFRRDAAISIGQGGDDQTIVVILGHTMSYGEYLELAHGGAYAIIMPTIEQYIPVLEAALKKLYSG
jgi:hypothetical protein